MSTQTWTYAEYAALPENGRRFELIEGSLVEMSSPTRKHQIVSDAFLTALKAAINGTDFRVFYAPLDVALGSDVLNACETVVQPDLLVVPNGSSQSCVLGAPPWVLEVLSPSTSRHDQVVKLRLYEKYGVGEYWVVNPDQRTVTAFRRQESVFLPGENFAFDQQLTICSLGVRVNLQTVATELARQDAIDQKAMVGQCLGNWTYAEYAALPEDGRRFELIEGSLVEMSSPTRKHQIVSDAFLTALKAVINGTDFRVFYAPLDVALGSDVLNACETVVQPDLLVVPNGSSQICLLGPPPWVLEVLSQYEPTRSSRQTSPV
jgi:Uma2 family endonuclease